MKVILRFTVPIFIGNILQQLYQLFDTMIVGQFVGSQAFAAVGSTSSIFSLITGFVWGITSGFAVPAAQSYGKKDLDETRHTFGNGILLSAILTLILTLGFVLCMPHLLNLMNTPSDIYDEALAYIRIICFGIAAQMLYGLMAETLRAIGNSKVPLFFLILSSILNIGLDLLLILPLKMGVQGAALATIISQGISGLLAFGYIWIKVPFLCLKKEDFIPEKNIITKELTMGLPIAMQYVITCTGMVFIQTSLNLLGTTYIIAYTAAVKVLMFLEQGPIAIGTAMATYSAQNKGAGNIDRIRQGVRASTIIMFGFFATVGTFIAFFGKYATYLFVTDNPGVVIDSVDLFLKIVAVTGILLGFLCIYRNTVQGMGYGVVAIAGGFIELAARALIAIITNYFHTFPVVCLGYPTAWLFATTFYVLLYIRIMKPHKIQTR